MVVAWSLVTVAVISNYVRRRLRRLRENSVLKSLNGKLTHQPAGDWMAALPVGRNDTSMRHHQDTVWIVR